MSARPTVAPATLTRWRAVETSMRLGRIEGEEDIRYVLVALAARAHVFLLGPPGVGKSQLLDSLTAHISGAQGFDTLMTRFSEPGELFGPVSLTALQADKYERAVDGYLPTAHVAFLDEIWKANSAILNALLKLTNERTYRNGTRTIRAPLISLLCASNELPGGDELGALYDRIAVRCFISPVSEAGFRRLIARDFASSASATMTLDDVQAGALEACAVAIPDAVLDVVAIMRRDGLRQGIKASDRRWLASLALVRASAWLDGRTVATVADLSIFARVLWDAPDARRKVEDFVLSYSAPMRRKALELLDAAREQRAILDSDAVEPLKLEASRKLRAMLATAQAGDAEMAKIAPTIGAWRLEAQKIINI